MIFDVSFLSPICIIMDSRIFFFQNLILSFNIHSSLLSLVIEPHTLACYIYQGGGMGREVWINYLPNSFVGLSRGSGKESAH